MQTSLLAQLAPPKLENNIAKIDAAVRRFIRRRPRQRFGDTKQRIVAVDRRKKILDGQAGRGTTSDAAAHSRPLWHLSNRLYSHICETTRSDSPLQAQSRTRAAPRRHRLFDSPVPATLRPC